MFEIDLFCNDTFDTLVNLQYMMIIYCMFGYNMDDNMKLYNEKILKLKFTNCKFSENVMRTVICNNDIVLDNITVLELFEYSFNLLVGLSIISKRILCYHAKKLSKLIRFDIIWIMFTVSIAIQNAVGKDLHSTSNYALIKLDLLRQMYRYIHIITIECNFNQYHSNCMSILIK